MRTKVSTSRIKVTAATVLDAKLPASGGPGLRRYNLVIDNTEILQVKMGIYTGHNGNI